MVIWQQHHYSCSIPNKITTLKPRIKAILDFNFHILDIIHTFISNSVSIYILISSGTSLLVSICLSIAFVQPIFCYLFTVITFPHHSNSFFPKKYKFQCILSKEAPQPLHLLHCGQVLLVCKVKVVVLVRRVLMQSFGQMKSTDDYGNLSSV